MTPEQLNAYRTTDSALYDEIVGCPFLDCAICGIMEGWVEFHEEDETTTVQKVDTTEEIL